MRKQNYFFLLFISILLYHNVEAQSLSKQNKNKSSAGGPPTRQELLGFWKIVEWPSAKLNKVNPWPMPYQWFSFYEDGRFCSMMNSTDAQYTTTQLDEVFSIFKTPPRFNYLGQFIEVTNPEIQGYKEIWGVNLFAEDVGSYVKKGDLMMTLAGEDGGVIYYRLLRKVE